MNKIRIFFLFIFLQGVISVSAQYIILGIRDNQFVRFGYTYKHWSGILEHSAFTSKFNNQVLNGYLEYKGYVGQLTYKGTAYGGFHYNKLYHCYGGICEGFYPLTPWCNVKAGFRPHYDSSYGYETAYIGSLEFKILSEIYLVTSYTNYPELRLCEKRFKGGIIVKVKNLIVKPEISLPIKNNLENIRLLLSFNYNLNIKNL